jgi:hypothetical protein
LLNHLNQSTIVPQKPNISQFVMGHDDYKEAVDAEFDEQMEETDTPANERMALRCKIAKDLFDAEDAETQQRLRQENDDQHNKLVVAAEQAASQSLPMLPSEDRQS